MSTCSNSEEKSVSLKLIMKEEWNSLMFRILFIACIVKIMLFIIVTLFGMINKNDIVETVAIVGATIFVYCMAVYTNYQATKRESLPINENKKGEQRC